jgi:hypothetical protein
VKRFVSSTHIHGLSSCMVKIWVHVDEFTKVARRWERAVKCGIDDKRDKTKWRNIIDSTSPNILITPSVHVSGFQFYGLRFT